MATADVPDFGGGLGADRRETSLMQEELAERAGASARVARDLKHGANPTARRDTTRWQTPAVRPIRTAMPSCGRPVVEEAELARRGSRSRPPVTS